MIHLSKESSNYGAKYQAAKQLLAIEEMRFFRIHTQELKKQRLTYLWLAAEFAAIAQNPNTDIQEKLQVIRAAYEYLLNTSLLLEHVASYSQFSVGLQELDIRSQYRPSITPNAPSSIDLEQSLMFQAPKSSGVEPGFEAFQKSDVLLELLRLLPDDEDRRRFIIDYKTNLEDIYSLLNKQLPKYLIKSDYRNISNGKVTPEEEDLRRSKTLQSIYEKSSIMGDFVTFIYVEVKKRTFSQINQDSVKEVLGNDVMRAYGVPAQEQYLLRSQYHDGCLKLMLKAKWLNGGSILGPVYGSQDNKGYRAKPVILPMEGIVHLADTNIENLPESLAAMLVLGDPDGIGSSAQNKLSVENRFVVIDTGHAFEQDIIDQVTEFFTVQPANFKNYSVFFATRSEILRGLLKIARVAGKNLSPSVLKSYGANFYQSVEKLSVGADVRIFDDYVKKFEEIQNTILADEKAEARADNYRCCNEIIQTIKVTKNKAITIRDKLIAKFEKYFRLETKAIELIENIEKFLIGKENTTLRSPDKTVLLHHLRVLDENKINWTVTIPEQQNGQCCFSFHFVCKEVAAIAWRQLQQWLRGNGVSEEIYRTLQFQPTTGSISFAFDYQKLPKLTTLFLEDKLKKYFHLKDYNLYLLYQAEVELLEILRQVEAKGIKATVQKSGTLNYSIAFLADDVIDSLFFNLVNHYFEGCKQEVVIAATVRDIMTACNALRTILFELEREKLVKAELFKIKDVVSQIQQLQPLFNLQFDRLPTNRFVCVVESENCDIVFKDIIKKYPMENLASDIAFSDLTDIFATIRKWLESYEVEQKKIANNIHMLEEYNNNAMSVLSLSVAPFSIVKTEPTGYQLTINAFSLPAHYVQIANTSLAQFASPESSVYQLTYQQLSSIIQLLDEISYQYLTIILDKKSALKHKIETLNSQLKVFFNCRSQILSVTEEMNNFRINFSLYSPMMSEVKALIVDKDIEGIFQTVSHQIEKYEQERARFLQLQEQLKSLLHLNTHLFSFDVTEGDFHLRMEKISRLEHKKFFDGIIKDFDKTKPRVNLCKALKNVNSAVEEGINYLNKQLQTKTMHLDKLLSAYFTPFNLDVLINLAYIQGELCFKLQISDLFLQSLVDEAYPNKDLGGYCLLEESQFEHAIMRIVEKLHQKRNKEEVEEAEGFLFIMEEMNKQDALCHLTELLNNVALNLKAKRMQNNQSSLLGQVATIFFGRESKPSTEAKDPDSEFLQSIEQAMPMSSEQLPNLLSLLQARYNSHKNDQELAAMISLIQKVMAIPIDSYEPVGNVGLS